MCLSFQLSFDTGYQDSDASCQSAEETLLSSTLEDSEDGDTDDEDQGVRCNICQDMRVFENMDELENHIETDHATMSLQDFVFALESRSLSANM